MRALALFSGGLDSAVAIKVIKDQGIDVVALNFVSHFFGGKNEKAEFMAKQLGVQLDYIDFKDEHLEITKNPPCGRGKNMNPCIDCHALMLKIAGRLLEKYDAQFVITGEVVGQRPMSQNKNSLNRVKKIANIGNIVVRPLSGKLLEATLPEIEGWIDREKLLDINGRKRDRQMEIMEKSGLKEYPSPGGGCLLTDPNFSKRLKMLEKDGKLDYGYEDLFYLIRHGRIFRFDSDRYAFVGRLEEENYKISEYKDKGSIYMVGGKTPGPAMVAVGDYNEEEVRLLKGLYARYSKSKGKTVTNIKYNGELIEIPINNHDEIKDFINKYQVY